MSDSTSLCPKEAIALLKERLPKGGLFSGKENMLSPCPFPLSKWELKRIDRLGRTLARFVKSCSTAYQQSREERLPSSIHGLLDAGKPEWLTELAASPGQKNALPRVIRPDLLLTEKGFAITELDNVPGGIGLVGFLTRLYAELGHEGFPGGPDGMVEGFRSLLPEGGDIVISEESGDYVPEMEWLAAQLGDEWSVREAEDYVPSDRAIYRFFELFDHENVPFLKENAERLASGELSLTPPPRPCLEEKLWLALFWQGPLRRWWERALRKSGDRILRDTIPYGWVVDPTPIPAHATLPRLEVNSWGEVAGFSQKDRELVLKISGYSELAWGSKSVKVGHDLPGTEWSDSIGNALGDFETHPWVMQEFRNARLVEHPYWNPETESLETMVGRVRLCPYYFVDWEGERDWEVQIGGVLATIVPAEKKLIHGMRDAILVPCVAAPEAPCGKA